MVYRIEESYLNGELGVEEMVEDYLYKYRKYILGLSEKLTKQECISGLNRIKRASYRSCERTDVKVYVGDVCYIDFGVAYINESGYQHFGLVISEENYKIQVVPMSSKPDLIQQAYNIPAGKGGERKRHLYYLGKPDGMYRESVLFLNDTKYLNSARVISVKAHINPESEQFKEIVRSIQDIMIPDC